MSEQCPTCGAPVGSGGGSGSDALIQHVTDYNDPHRTLSLVPRTYYGNSAPVVADGYKSGDWYVDVTNRVIYSCTSVAGEHGPELSWVPASTATAVTAAMLAAALAPYATTASVQALLSSYVTTSVAASFVTADQLAARNYATQSDVTSALNGYATEAYVTSLGYTTLSAVQAYLAANYVSSSALATALASYYTRSEADSRFVTPAMLSGFVNSSYVADALSHGFVYRQPTEPGVWPTLDLDVILGSYLTSSAASATYLTKTAAANTYSTPASVQAALAGYVTALGLSSALAPYYTASQCDAKYVTPAYLSAQGYLRSGSSDFFANFVTRSATGSRDIDVILSTWAVSELSTTETRPPQTSAVKAAIDAEAAARTSLASSVSDLSITGGAANLLHHVTTGVMRVVSGTYATHLALKDSAVNWIDSASSLIQSNKIRLSVPRGVSSSVARDFLFCITFSGAAVGQVPFTVDSVVNYDSTALEFISYVDKPFSLAGVAYGATVIWGFTECAPGKFAVTRKILYPVESGYGV